MYSSFKQRMLHIIGFHEANLYNEPIAKSDIKINYEWL